MRKTREFIHEATK